MPFQPEESKDKESKDEYTFHSHKDPSAKGIFILSIGQSILIDKCNTSSVKKIWDYKLSQYKKTGFVLRLTFFVYLTNSKVSVFQSITAYNTYFQITQETLVNDGWTLPSYLQLATYLYKIKNIYLDFTVSQQSAARTEVAEIWEVML